MGKSVQGIQIGYNVFERGCNAVSQNVVNGVRDRRGC
jgi:hypothetical protein